MKNIFAALLALVCSTAFAQSYPSPTYNNLTVLGTFTSTGNIGLGSLAAQAANTVVANATASSASPTAVAVPSCSGANNALRWTSGSGFTCASAIALTSNPLSQFAATTSAQLAGIISDETGSGSLVFGTNPTLAGASVTSTLNVTSTSPLMNFNATSGATLGTINFQAAGSTAWQVQPTTSIFPICRYSAGTFVDCPFSISNSTGLLTLIDGLAVTGTVSGTGFSNYLASPPAIGGTTANTGRFTTLTATSTITPSSTAGVVGTTTNDNANAGSFGEYTPASTTGTSLTSGTNANATSMNLTAGDWDVSGIVIYNPAGSTTVSNLVEGISTTSATFGAAGTFSSAALSFTTGAIQRRAVPVMRISVASTTTVYLVTQATFGASTMTVDGYLRARRVR
ncbi:hypothetical protein [Burkholderia vietnamiensis]|uniref:hypothetical protein n=1 Tax=Burkholderia vietnamiensis TaxID=60552 RepID=UPI0026515BDA|nr:hypothetical protein [Burkholderia vietnamiensis]MDN8066200.1 hypothetical protein [Burkholderia vietnamiensis]